MGKEERKLYGIAMALKGVAWLILLVGGAYELLHLVVLAETMTDEMVVWSVEIVNVLWKLLWIWTAWLLLREVALGLQIMVEIRQNLGHQKEEENVF